METPPSDSSIRTVVGVRVSFFGEIAEHRAPSTEDRQQLLSADVSTGSNLNLTFAYSLPPTACKNARHESTRQDVTITSLPAA
jgi:hypothetical protein